MSTITKAVGVLLAAGVLCGVGAGTALATTPSGTAGRSGARRNQLGRSGGQRPCRRRCVLQRHAVAGGHQ